ncbi:hypothetical protein SAMN04489760_10163 [Syntrophus gentianae]|uniref:Uncharacterized protein n=1 Tax=Syntrophus gentianae TaxID=43775 RepID=A0A1H7UAT5_9BACT|nr:hypothetical protein [Syntrophus gentianae]SEL93798.1 hypothetical protein SAMN04489760_10163 [Syntrophus gentianae]
MDLPIWIKWFLGFMIATQPVLNFAYAASECDAVWDSGAFNKSRYAESASLLLKKKDAACSQNYQNKGEAEEAAKKAGGEIGIGSWSFQGAEAEKIAETTWSISKSSLCLNASAEELASFTSIQAKSQVTDLAVRAWSDCIERSETNKLFVEYTTLIDGTGMTGWLISHPDRADGYGTIKDVAITNLTAKDQPVTCLIGGRRVIVNKDFRGCNIPITKDRTAISCTKNPRKSINIALKTDQVAPPGIIAMPSLANEIQTRINEVNDAVHALRIQLMQSVQRLSSESVRIVRGEVGNLGKVKPGDKGDGGVAYCNDDEYVLNGGGWCTDARASLIWSGPVEAGEDIWGGEKAEHAGWRADCSSPADIGIVPAGAFVTCIKKR